MLRGEYAIISFQHFRTKRATSTQTENVYLKAERNRKKERLATAAHSGSQQPSI